MQHGEGVDYIHFTMVLDCRLELTTSTANLERTIIQFSPSVLPYHTTGSNSRSGDAVLSSNNQVMTITVRGRCAGTYFDERQVGTYFDDPSEEHLLPVRFKG